MYNKKRILIISQWSYPAGGGEAFLFNSASWLSSLKWDVFWISFSSFNNVPHKSYDYSFINNIHFIKLSSLSHLKYFVKLLNPDVIHHQGNLRMEVLHIASSLRIPLISGFHFWNDAIELYNGNKDILQHIDKHKVSPNFNEVIRKSTAIYCCSNFIKDVIQDVSGYYINNVIYPIPTIPYTFKLKPLKDRSHITIINIHPLKGGNLFIDLIDKTNLPFLIINSEPIPIDFKQKLDTIISTHNNITYLDYQSNIFDIYNKTRILLIPSEVDETFCRVCLEAMMLKIPIITTGNGNIINLVGSSYPYLCKSTDDWLKTINFLYNNTKKINDITKILHQKYTDHFKLDVAKDTFCNMVNTCVKNNIGILVPWCDQGLGIQARNYVKIFAELGINIAVFSFKPYQRKSAYDLQQNRDEWIHNDIYYSDNIREDITDAEIIDFVEKYNINTMIIPETCWKRIFEIAKLLKQLNVRTYAIPNIEIVRKDELYKHKYFDYILANNQLCYSLFVNNGFNNVYQFGYANHHIVELEIIEDEIVKFLFIGGLNAFTRKQCLEVCQSFVDAAELVDNIHLTVSILSNDVIDVIKEYMNHPNITVIVKHQSMQEINELYQSSDVFIQVSKHEGLGLGFYDSLYNNVPVLTLDTAPHNEIITDELGWKIPCSYRGMTDNNDSLIQSAYFNNRDLMNKIVEISEKSAEIEIKKTKINSFCKTNLQKFKDNVAKLFA